jgi:DNA-binding response OmpR family regulator
MDDDAYSWKICEKALKPQGYALRCAGNAKEGLEFLEKESFRAVLLALKIPDMDGIEVLGKINEDWPDTKVVMIASSNALGPVVHALTSGADDFIVKPFSPAVLLAVINNLF